MNNTVEFKSDFLSESYKKVEHKSGLTVYIFPKDRITSCAILATEYGSVDNCFYSRDDGKYIEVPEGIAHFLEHKMFDNEDGTNIDDMFSSLGADPNAYTSWEETGYFFTCSENFYDSLSLLIRFVTHPYFTSESIEKEQGIIGQEIAMGEDDPYDRCYMNMVRGLYKNNPVRLEIAGSKRSISKIDTELLYKCHRTFYSPSNMVLITCGKVEENKVMEIVDRELGSSFDGNAEIPLRKYPSDKKRVFERHVESHMQVERPMFCIGFKDSNAPDNHKERRRKQIIAELVTGTVFAASGSLYSNMFKRGIMTTPFNYGEEYGKTYAFCYAGGECDDPNLLLKEIKKYISGIRRNGISEEDFNRRKKMIYSYDIKLYDSTWDIANALFDNAFWNVDIFSDAKTVEEINIEEANHYLKEVFREDRITYSVIYPDEEERTY